MIQFEKNILVRRNTKYSVVEECDLIPSKNDKNEFIIVLLQIWFDLGPASCDNGREQKCFTTTNVIV
jgi:hypothetical protein